MSNVVPGKYRVHTASTVEVTSGKWGKSMNWKTEKYLNP
jgi:hypothetical protein